MILHGNSLLGSKNYLNFMNTTARTLTFILIIIAALSACDEGERLPNQPPETRIFLNNIGLDDANRLNTIIKLHWSGEDQDGYVVGYEISFDNTNWSFVEGQDSVFRLSLNSGGSNTDIDFFVRAIDNRQLVDPSPAFLRIPIQNTPPKATFSPLVGLPDTVYSVFSMAWDLEDIDGNESIDTVFMKLNDGPWYPLSPLTSFATIIAEDTRQEGVQAAKLYLNITADLQESRIEGLRVGEDNQVYIRARDVAGSFGETDSTKTFFLRPQLSERLVVDVHSADIVDEFYAEILPKVSSSYETLVLEDNVPAFWQPTFTLLLELYDQVFWYSDGREIDVFDAKVALEAAANSVQTYLNNGGKMFISMRFPGSFNDAENADASLIFPFSPIDSLTTVLPNIRILRSDSLYTVGDAEGRYPDLAVSSIILGGDLYYPKNEGDILYKTTTNNIDDWSGPNNIAGKTRFTNGRTNQVFFTVELNRLDGNPGAVEELFDIIMNEEFDW